jgi:hypothetical protein
MKEGSVYLADMPAGTSPSVSPSYLAVGPIRPAIPVAPESVLLPSVLRHKLKVILRWVHKSAVPIQYGRQRSLLVRLVL